jgi:hypothetical protein
MEYWASFNWLDNSAALALDSPTFSDGLFSAQAFAAFEFNPRDKAFLPVHT